MFSHKDTEARRREEGSRKGDEAQKKREEREEYPPITLITPIGETKADRTGVEPAQIELITQIVKMVLGMSTKNIKNFLIICDNHLICG